MTDSKLNLPVWGGLQFDPRKKHSSEQKKCQRVKSLTAVVERLLLDAYVAEEGGASKRPEDGPARTESPVRRRKKSLR